MGQAGRCPLLSLCAVGLALGAQPRVSSISACDGHFRYAVVSVITYNIAAGFGKHVCPCVGTVGKVLEKARSCTAWWGVLQLARQRGWCQGALAGTFLPFFVPGKEAGKRLALFGAREQQQLAGVGPGQPFDLLHRDGLIGIVHESMLLAGSYSSPLSFPSTACVGAVLSIR